VNLATSVTIVYNRQLLTFYQKSGRQVTKPTWNRSLCPYNQNVVPVLNLFGRQTILGQDVSDRQENSEL